MTTLLTVYLLLQGTSSNLTASSSGGTARNSSTFSDTAVAIATEIAENEVCCGWVCYWLSSVCIYTWTDLQIAHVRYLRAALTAAGATPVACPSLALSPAIFTAAATGNRCQYLLLSNVCSNCYCAFCLRVPWFAAAVSALNATIATNTSATAFNPYSSDAAFYLGAYIFEDVGVSAVMSVASCFVAVS